MKLSCLFRLFLLIPGSLFINKVSEVEINVPYYSYENKLDEYACDHQFHYQDPPYGRILDFTIDLKKFEGLEYGKIYIPFIRHYNDGNINYKMKIVNDSETTIVGEGVNKPTDYNYHGEFSIGFNLPLNKLGMKSEVIFETWQDGAINRDFISFYLTTPNFIYPTEQYALIYSYVVFEDDILHNYEERFEFINLPKELYIKNYFKMYSDYLYLKYGVYNNNQKFQQAFLLFIDEPGYLKKSFNEYSQFPDYYGMNLDYFDSTPIEGVMRLFYQKALYLDLETLMMSTNKNDFKNYVAVRDLFFPINKFDEYRYFPMRLYIKNAGRSSTDIVYDFLVIFGDEHIQETLDVARGNPIKEFTPYMEEVII